MVFLVGIDLRIMGQGVRGDLILRVRLAGMRGEVCFKSRISAV